MEPIRSGTTTERIVRTGILTAMLVVFAIWSFRDGYFHYPRSNVPNLVQNLHNPPDPQTLPLNPAVTKVAAEELRQRAGAGLSVSEVRARFGEPAAEEGGTEYHFGPGGMAKLAVAGSRVLSVDWVAGEHDETDLFLQKVMGFVVGSLGLLALLQLGRVLLTRIELSDGGLKVNSQGGLRFGGSPLVPFEAMTGLGAADFRKKGWIDVHYTVLNGRSGKVSLNDYVHKAFPQVIHAICDRKGFEDPIRAEQDEKAAKELE